MYKDSGTKPSSYARPEGLSPIKSKRNKNYPLFSVETTDEGGGLEKPRSHPVRIIERMDLPCPVTGSDSPSWASSDPTEVESLEVISSGGHTGRRSRERNAQSTYRMPGKYPGDCLGNGTPSSCLEQVV